jgi:hypothetical protein
MKACDRCQLRGYSRELCAVHIHHCGGLVEEHPPSPGLKIVGRVAAGVAVGIFASLLVTASVSFVSGSSVFRTLLPVLVVASSIAGAAYGLVQGILDAKESGRRRPPLRPNRTRRTQSRAPVGVFFLGNPAPEPGGDASHDGRVP